MTKQIIDRQRGALLGLCCGDSLGVAVEFRPPGTFPPITEYRGGGPFSLNKGDWSDDTSMALALADSIKNMGWNLNDQAERYLDWYENGKYSVNGSCFDIGTTCRTALDAYGRNKRLSAPTEPETSGNGCIMRIAPVAIRYYGYYPEHLYILAKMGEDSSLVTHGSKMCLSASAYMTVLLSALIKGESKETVLAEDWYKLPLHRSVEEVVKGSYKKKQPPTPKEWHPDLRGFIRGSGFVVDALEAALWAFYRTESFKEAVTLAVNLGEDTDTSAAITGQIAGAYYGESGIPQDLRDGLSRKDMIEEALAGLITGETNAA